MITKNALWIFAEKENERIAPVTFQLITKAKAIAGKRPVAVVLCETPAQQLEETLQPYGPDEIIVVKDALFAKAPDSVYANVLAELNEHYTPNALLFGATPIGRSVAPRLQAKLRTGLTADCLDLYYEDDLLVQVKPSYGDNVMCEIICPDHLPQMASIRPNTFPAHPLETPPTPTIETVAVPVKAPTNITLEQDTPKVAASTGIAGASKIIALGRGADDDNIVAEARKIAAKLGASVGVSRPLTDRPDFTVEQQIGQSGTTVAPDFILNVGISGSVQYQVGMTGSKLIVSVNRDANAPLFSQSDYTYTGDAKAFMAALAKAVE